MSLFDIFQTPGPRRQLAWAMAAAVVITVALVVLYLLVVRSPYRVLFSHLRTMDAASIVAELDKKKVPYRLEEGGATILVPAKLVDTTRLAVMSEDLPLKGAVGFELFNKSDMGLTEFAQKINYRRALQGELARTIMGLDTVESARVHLSLTEPTIFRDDRRPSKASVTVIPRQGRTLAAGTIRGIQHLVAAAVPDLDVADVVILDERGQVVSPDAPAGPQPLTAQAQQRQAIEQYYAAKVRLAVQAFRPGEPFDVTVTAGLAPAALGAATPDLDADALANWSPAARRFPLQVAIAPPRPLASAEQDDVRRAAGEAIGVDLRLSDAIVMTAPRPAGPVVAEPRSAAPLSAGPRSAGTRPDPATAEAPGSGAAPTAASGAKGLEAILSPRGAWWILALLILIVVAGGFGLRRPAAPRRLSAAQREDYARRLQGLLDQEAPRAVPRG